MIRVLISSCLLGQRVRWNGAGALASHPLLEQWSREGRLVPFCPELHAGLGVPRPPAEIDGTAAEVLAGNARILTDRGLDVSQHFIAGARGAASEAKRVGARLAILKDGSPSCGSTWIYDGSFSGSRIAGRGVTTSVLLDELDLRVFSEAQIEDAAAYLLKLELETGSGQPSR